MTRVHPNKRIVIMPQGDYIDGEVLWFPKTKNLRDHAAIRS